MATGIQKSVVMLQSQEYVLVKDIKNPVENKGNNTEHYGIMSIGSLLEHLDIDGAW